MALAHVTDGCIEQVDNVLTFLQAIVLGFLQGVTQLVPVSSLGHSVILPQLLGWTDLVAAQSAAESYLRKTVTTHSASSLISTPRDPRC